MIVTGLVDRCYEVRLITTVRDAQKPGEVIHEAFNLESPEDERRLVIAPRSAGPIGVQN